MHEDAREEGAGLDLRLAPGLPLVRRDQHVPALADRHDEGSLIRSIDAGDAAGAMEAAAGRMKVKVESALKAIEAGADEYVMKPFDHETLQIKLQLVGFA